MIQTLQITLSKKLKNNSSTGNMAKRASNFQTEKALKDIDEPDINDNFVGVFLARQINKFIDYKTMISEKRQISFYSFYYSEH